MKHGPVGSSTKDILKKYDVFFSNLDSSDIEYYQKYLTHDKDDILVNEACAYNELSKSETNALDFSLNNFGEFDQFILADITHDYPEWKKFEKAIQKGIIKVADMNYLDFFKNPQFDECTYVNRYFNEDPFKEEPEVLESIKEYIESTSDLRN